MLNISNDLREFGTLQSKKYGIRKTPALFTKINHGWEEISCRYRDTGNTVSPL